MTSIRGSSHETTSHGTTVHGVRFDRVRDAVADLGWDPRGRVPIDAALADAVEDGTLIDVPPGTYAVATVPRRRRVSRFGIRGVGPTRASVRFRPASDASGSPVAGRIVALRGGTGHLFTDFTVDFGPDRRRGALGIATIPDDDLQIRRLAFEGFTPANPHGQWKLFVGVGDPRGTGVVADVVSAGPSHITGHGGTRAFAGVFNHHRGTLTFRRCRVANDGGDGAVYAGRHGTVRFEDCHFENCAMAAVRAGGPRSWLKRCTVVVDVDDAHPGNLGRYRGTNAVYWDPGPSRRAGGLIEDCDVIVRSSAAAQAAIAVDSSAGALTIRDTRIRIDADGVPAVLAHAPGKRFGRTARRPWGITLEGVHVTGWGRLPADRRDRYENAVVVLERRPGSVVRNCCFEMPNADAGVSLRRWRGIEPSTCAVTGTNVVVGTHALDDEDDAGAVTSWRVTDYRGRCSGPGAPVRRAGGWV